MNRNYVVKTTPNNCSVGNLTYGLLSCSPTEIAKDHSSWHHSLQQALGSSRQTLCDRVRKGDYFYTWVETMSRTTKAESKEVVKETFPPP